MTIFAEMMKKAVLHYRQLLRKLLPQAVRVKKLNQLGLRKLAIFQNEKELYQVGYKIIEHLQEMDQSQESYYSYSGLSQFADHLENFLSSYEIDGDKVIHRAQKTSRIMIETIQLVTLPKIQLTDEIGDKIKAHGELIAKYGSHEQHTLFLETLKKAVRYHKTCNAFFIPIIDHFEAAIATHRQNLIEPSQEEG